MDGAWTLPILPTACPADNKTVTDRFIEIFPEFQKTRDNEFIVEQVRGLTTQLVHRHSYNPATWMSRAYNLLRLGYPDLAAGDAVKGLMLLDIRSSPGTKLKEAVDKELRRETEQSVLTQTYGDETNNDRPSRINNYCEYLKDRVIMVLAQALFRANCFVECYEVLKHQSKGTDDKFEKFKELAEHAQLTEDLSRLDEGDFVQDNDPVSQETQRSGSITPRTYPWSAPFIQRGGRISSVASEAISMASKNGCSLRCSSIADETSDTNEVEKEANTFGIVADVDFNNGALLFMDPTFLSGINNPENCCSCCRVPFDQLKCAPLEFGCCDIPFCSTDCLKLAENYHYVMCRKAQNLNKLPQLQLDHDNVSADTKAFASLLYRLLAHVEQTPETHPLRTPTAGAMIPAYRNTSPICFSLLEDIRRPFSMLMLLEVDIFNDHSLDTWVIQTLKARLLNNVRDHSDESGRSGMAINLSYIFLNHSCDPNVRIVPHCSGSTELLAIASRPIKQGEELFTSYIPEEKLDLLYAQRQELLKHWTGGECRCLRCSQERNGVNVSKEKL